MYTKLNDDDPLVGGFILTKLERGNEGDELYQIRRESLNGMGHKQATILRQGEGERERERERE